MEEQHSDVALATASPPPPYRQSSPYTHSPSIPFIVGSTSTAGGGMTDAPSRIKAYARLEFQEGIDFYIRSLSVMIGRRPLLASSLAINAPPTPSGIIPQPAIERSPLLRPVSAARSTSPAMEEAPKAGDATLQPDHVQVDVDLGPIKAVSRQHARLFYDYQANGWSLEVKGRNGVVVDGTWSMPGERVDMHHGSRIQIAERIFYFMLPASSLQPIASTSKLSLDSSTESSSSASPPPSSAPIPVVKAKPAPVKAAVSKAKPAKKPAKPKAPAVKPKKPPAPAPIPLTAVASKGKGKLKQETEVVEVEEDVKPLVPIVMPKNEHAGKAEKPPYTMTSLLAQAVSHAPEQRAGAAYVARWIGEAYPYFAKDRALSAEVERRLQDPRFFVQLEDGTYAVSSDPQQIHYFDGTLFRKRGTAQAPAAAKAASPAVATPAHGSPSAPPLTVPPVPSTVPPVPVAAPPVLPVASPSAVARPSPSPAPLPGPVAPSMSPSATNSTAPLPILIEPLPASYDTSKAPSVPGLAEPPIVIHDNKLILSPAVFRHLAKDPTKLAALRAMPTEKAMTALRAFLVAFLKAKAEKKRKAEAPVASGEGGGKEAKVVKME